MSRRTNVYVTLRKPAATRPSPNATVSEITVEIRAFWPPGMGHMDTIVDMLNEAADQAVQQIADKQEKGLS